MQTLRYAMASLLLALFALANVAQANPVTNPKSTAYLLSEYDAVSPGQALWLMVHLDMIDHWHTYWVNPGDSGLPMEVSWTLPDGWGAEAIGTIQWLPPKPIIIEPLVNFGYYDDTYYPIRLKVPESAAIGEQVVLTANASWLICDEICVPEQATLSLPLNIVEGGAERVSAAAEKIQHAVSQLPQPVSGEGGYTIKGDYLELNHPIESLSLSELSDLVFYPLDNEWISNAGLQEFKRVGDQLWMRSPVGAVAPYEGASYKGVLVWKFDGKTNARYVQFVQEKELKGSPFGGDSGGRALPVSDGGGDYLSSKPANNGASIGFWSAVFFAILGGVILNAMPCVFPILSLKTLAISKKVAAEPAKVRMQGFAYTVGVLASFGVMAGILVAVQQGGQAVGWGYQMQSPLFVALLAYLLFLVGLNLSGVFELPSHFANFGGRFTEGEGAIASFFTGVLATLVATPCTAPFMAPAIGYALTLAPVQAVLIFLALGFGLALPYLLVSLFPVLVRWLPKPGVWMLTFRQFLAFPMYGSAAWLVWVLAQQTDAAGLAMILTGLTVLGFAVWCWQKVKDKAELVRWVWLAILLGLVIYPLVVIDRLDPNPHVAATTEAGDLVIEPYSQARLDALLTDGKPVFVNATAAWCITCKVNERVALRGNDFIATVNRLGVTYLEADWTNRDAAITALLEEFGRSGVPLYAMYQPDKEPMLLPQLLTESLVIDEFESYYHSNPKGE